jgi:hypothetical protein
MILQEDQYPEFVADQLLTTENLNSLFMYLDEQGRATRTNLIGVGIACGLHVKTSLEPTSITITKGTGVTSEGYLVSLTETTYTHYVPFNFSRPEVYEKFSSRTGQPQLTLWELKESAGTEGALPLTASFLAGDTPAEKKIVMLFVELLREGNRTCNPTSCDDKGITINVSIRPLLVSEENVRAFGLNAGQGSFWVNQEAANLGEIRIPRFDVTNTFPVSSADVFLAYQSILNVSFLERMQQVLTEAYTFFNVLVADEFPGNPFATLASSFAFLHNGEISKDALLHIQYYYDLFADLIAAYDEFKITGTEVLATCCPDNTLFPRHVLLGEAITVNDFVSSYRHYFIGSPLYGDRNLLNRLKILFRRMVMIKDNFRLPLVQGENARLDSFIRITPSKLIDAPLSEKAIPYYYSVNNDSGPLYKAWSITKTRLGQAHRNLSYHAQAYNDSDDFVLTPLKFDLEPYNFFRVEGHIGKNYVNVLTNLKQLIKINRVPFQVVAVKTFNVNAPMIEGFASGVSADVSGLTSQNFTIDYLELSYNIAWSEWKVVVAAPVRVAFTNQEVLQLIDPENWTAFVKVLQDVNVYSTHTLEQFVSQYLVFEKLLISAGKTATALRADMTAKVKASKDEYERFLLEDLIDHVDEIILAFKKNIFRKIYDEFTKKAGDLDSPQYLNHYLQKNPGIQHKGGVPVGGTLVLVVHNKKRVLPKIWVSGKVFYDKGGPLPGASVMVKGTNNGTVTDVDGRYSIQVNSREDILVFSFVGLQTQEVVVGNNTYIEIKLRDIFIVTEFPEPIESPIPDPFSDNILDKDIYDMRKEDLLVQVEKIYHVLEGGVVKGKSTLDDLVAEMAEGTVIADFYLPYVCCSDRSPLQYVVQQPEEPSKTVTLELQPNKINGKNEYCSDDQSSYKFSMSPAGGTLSSMEGVVLENDTFNFYPGKLVQAWGEQTSLVKNYVYQKDGISSPAINVTVYHRPVADFDVTLNPDDSGEIWITNKSSYANKFVWDFGDNTQRNDRDPKKHVYAKEGMYTIRLTATHELSDCAVETKKEITIKLQVKKTCTDISNMLDIKAVLKAADNKNLALFYDPVIVKNGIDIFFEQLNAVIDDKNTAQINFFESFETHGLKIHDHLVNWSAGLEAFFIEEEKTLRVLAMTTFRMLVKVSMYIPCIHDKDVDEPMVNVFNKLAEVLNTLAGLANLSSKESLIRKQIQDDIEIEYNHVVENAAGLKPKYKSVLEKWRNIK